MKTTPNQEIVFHRFAREPTQFEPCKVEAQIHSIGQKKPVFLVQYEDVNHCKAVYDNKLCTAIYNTYNGMFYVDDKYGVLDTLEA